MTAVERAAMASERDSSSTATAWSLHDVSFHHHGFVSPTLNRVSLDIREGRMTALLGPNGAGKSTLLQILLGTLTPTRGEVLFRDRAVSRWDRKTLAREIGVVPQGETEPLFSVREVVAMGRYPHLGAWQRERDEDVRAVRRAMERCDVVEFADRWLSALSGGERQRVRLARALAQDPSVLVLDEPTTFLDVRHEMLTFALLRELCDDGTTVLLATHNLNLAARYADDLVLLRHGTVVGRGTPSDVLTASGIESVYEWPVSIVPHAGGAPQVVPNDVTGR